MVVHGSASHGSGAGARTYGGSVPPKTAKTATAKEAEPAAPSLGALLEAAVAAVGGTERTGQVQMAEAVSAAMSSEQHLLVQAGTGTGKSLAYLIPALHHGHRVVVATATLALQSQLVDRDLPRVVGAVEPLLGRVPTYALVKGRANYACLNRVRGGVPDEQGTLVEIAPSSTLGKEVLRIRRWVDTTATGDRDELVPGVSDRAWSQTSVSARECLGADRCPDGAECFAERARWAARKADVVVTNHALLAIDALHNRTVLPDHDVLVVDEAHELVSRVTGAASAELTASMVERAARFARSPAGGELADPLDEAGVGLGLALEQVPVGRLDELPQALIAALAAVRDTARAVLTVMLKVVASEGGPAETLTGEPAEGEPGSGAAYLRRVQAYVGQVFDTAERLVINSDEDVAWLEDRERGGRMLKVAPLSVAALLRDKVLDDRTVVLTSATLAIGGTFEPVARSIGLDGPAGADGEWDGLDVGSPFDYPKQAMLYVARRLPTPGRDGPSPELLAELAELVAAAGGRTLGLFSSRRAAELAAAYLREHVETPILCQGDDGLVELGRRFHDDPTTSLVGTLSLWQGIDVPGPTCQLVVIDRIPFPRPDDPLASARQRAIDEAGGNGFMAVSATLAGLLLAQGSGRLVRTMVDRGVVAVLDPRLATARYRDFLLKSLPPMWRTTDREVALAALRRLDAEAIGSV